MSAVKEDRLWNSHLALGAIGATPAGGVNRLALSSEEISARRLLASWAEDAGWKLGIDAIGNLFIRRDGLEPDLPAVMTGSHIDTQPTGGKFDGAYGVLAGIEVLRALDDARIQTRRPVEVAIWTNEEGCRFSPGMMGSEAFAGIRSVDKMLPIADADGVTVAQALPSIIDATKQAQKRPLGFPVHAYIEAHIEQGPELEVTGNTIGVVTGIQGTCRFRVEIFGEEAHAGTTKRRLRRDTLLTATRIIQAIEQHVEKIDPEDELRLTFGMLKVRPNVPSVVAAWSYFSIDLRHSDDTVMLRLANEIEPICQRHANGCEVKVTEIQRALKTSFSGIAFDSVSSAVQSLGYPYIRMPSGAGHDARQLARVCPTGMVFVPCAGGVSHNEAESAKPADLAAGTQVLAHALLDLADRIGG